jgi:heat shock protein HslJ
MTRAGRGLLAATITAGLLLATAMPAMAGDIAAPRGTLTGDWKTRTMGVKQTVTFDGKGHVYGDSGCNRFTGGYTVKGSTLKVGPLASTMMFCEGKMDAEAVFLNKLQHVVSYSATDTTLKLFTPKDLTVFKAA